MKKFIIGFYIMSLLMVEVNASAQSNCVTNSSGDETCSDAKNPNVTYTISSATTLAVRAKAQAIKDQQESLIQQQQTLNNTALQEVIANQISNDAKLSAQQATITKALNSLEAQAK